MKADWRILAKTVALTAIVTTVFWFAMAAWWFQRPLSGGDKLTISYASEMLLTGWQHRQVDSEPRLIIPVAGVRPDQLVDTFNEARAEGARHHDAIDIIAPRGTPVVAAAPGRVEKLFLSKDGGNTVYIRSPDGRRLYYYAHLDSYAPGLREGLVLPQGAPVGAVGSTGNADPDSPHLHFAIWITTPEKHWWEQAIAIDPYPLLR